MANVHVNFNKIVGNTGTNVYLGAIQRSSVRSFNQRESPRARVVLSWKNMQPSSP